jgi:FMN phosphatase YigB (HAD superfamily)/DNA-binding XRE family transcriptional regulator
MNEKTLGKRLQLARKRANLTQQELCQKAGLSYSTLAKIERGAIRSPSVFTVAAIANATGTPLESLLDLQVMGLSSPALATKKRSRTGVRFVYVDINGTLVRFLHKAFTDIADKASEPSDLVEALFWRHHDSLASGRITLEEFNSLLGGELNLQSFNWLDYYMANIEPMPHAEELVGWLSTYYELGIFSNNFPGVVDALLQQKIIPGASYAAIVDSSKVGLVKPDPQIYDAARELASVEAHEIMLIDNERPNLTTADRAGWQILLFDEFNPETSIERVKNALAF